MKPYAKREVERAFLSKGFRKGETDHTKYFFYYKDKKTSLYAKISHQSSGKDVIQRELRGMARTLKMTAMQLISIINCTWKEEDIKRHAEEILGNLYK